MADSTRIDDLRRRVEAEPLSIAFAQLAEEYRRAGNFADAVRVARAGLSLHPDYHSARVTLGRALAALGLVDEAGSEFLAVLQAAPGHVGAARALATVGPAAAVPASDRQVITADRA